MIVPPAATDRPDGAVKLMVAPAGLDIAVEAVKRVAPKRADATRAAKTLRILEVAS